MDLHLWNSYVYIYIYIYIYDTLSDLLVNKCIYIPLHNLFAQTLYIISMVAAGMVTLLRMEGIIIVISCALFCNVFSTVNET